MNQSTTQQTRKIYSDIDITFDRHPVTNDVSLVTNENAVKKSLKNLLSTKFDERVFQPTVGSNVSNLLFELPTQFTSYSLVNEIERLISNFEPRVHLTDRVSVVYQELDDAYIISIPFTLVNSPDQLSLTISLQRVR